MDRARRTFLTLAAGAVALPATIRGTWAQAYPTRPVRVVIGYPAGIGPDIIGRLASEGLARRLGQPFAVENRPGAATNLAAEFVAKAAPDGYTLLVAVAGNTINVSFYDKLSFDFVRDIVPVAPIAATTFVMIVNGAFPAKTVPEFIAYAKGNPGKVNMASQGNGSAPHVFGELFKMMAGLNLVHVPYRGDFMADLLAGQVQVAFNPIVQSMQYVRAGQLRALAVTTTQRSAVLPDVPAMTEFLPGYAASGWVGIGAPRGTPADIVTRLNRAVATIVADPTVTGRLAGMGAEPMTMTPAEFGQFIIAETERWRKVIKFSGIKPD
jgi:tripartite-type tricarboxylate transporter receptor subunit TctC